MSIYLCNGFSNSMFIDPRIKRIDEPISESEFIDLIHHCDWKSAIGHESLAKCLSKITGKEITRNRLNLNVGYDDVLIMVSLKGRLPEHPTYVEYKGRLTYSFVRFEKQTMVDIENSLKRLEEIKMEA